MPARGGIAQSIVERLLRDIDETRADAARLHASEQEGASADGPGAGAPSGPAPSPVARPHPVVRYLVLSPLVLLAIYFAWGLVGRPGGEEVGTILRVIIIALIVALLALRWGAVVGLVPWSLLGKEQSWREVAFRSVTLVLLIAALVTQEYWLLLLVPVLVGIRVAPLVHRLTLVTMRQRELARLRSGAGPSRPIATPSSRDN